MAKRIRIEGQTIHTHQVLRHRIPGGNGTTIYVCRCTGCGRQYNMTGANLRRIRDKIHANMTVYATCLTCRKREEERELRRKELKPGPGSDLYIVEVPKYMSVPGQVVFLYDNSNMSFRDIGKYFGHSRQWAHQMYWRRKRMDIEWNDVLNIYRRVIGQEEVIL